MPKEEFQPSSFIPKANSGYDKSSRQKQIGILLTIAIVFVVLAVVAAAAAFFYTQYLEDDLMDKQTQLQAAQAGFGPEAITQLSQLNARISTAEQLLGQHTAVTPVFEVIEAVTLAGVQLTSASISKDGNESNASGNDDESEGSTNEFGGVSITLEGIARDYAALILQVEALEDNVEAHNPSLDDFSLSDEGQTNFTISFSISEDYMSYNRSLE